MEAKGEEEIQVVDTMDAKGEEEIQVVDTMEAKQGEEEIQVVVKVPTGPLIPACSTETVAAATCSSIIPYVPFTSFGPKNDNTHLHNPKLLSVADSQICSEDADSVDDGFSSNDDEGCVDDDVNGIWYDEKVKMKLRMLAAMVGITHTASTCPEDVLGEVVRVLKELEQKRKHGNGINHNKSASV